MQLYTILMKCWEYISFGLMIIIQTMIVLYFVRETVTNIKGKNLINYYDSEKELKRKIEKEQRKTERLISKNGEKNNCKR